MPGKVDHFKSEESYRKWRAYRHLHGIESKAEYVEVAGKRHKVDHSKKRGRKRGHK